MTQEDEYITVPQVGTAQTMVKGSRFIASVAPVSSEEKVRAFIARVSHTYHDASHHCSAYRVGLGDQALVRHSDGGEPSGTAGRPILEAIDRAGLSDVVVVVTRYFGGTKLGTGGLARAYGECAQKALDAAGTVKKYLTIDVDLEFPYDLTKEVHKIAGKYSAQSVVEEYGQQVRLTVRVRQSQSREFVEEMRVMGKGRVNLQMTG